MVLAARQRAWLIAGVCTAASVLGGIAGYGIGYFLFAEVGQPLLDFYGYQDKFAEFRDLYNAWGAWIVFGAGLTPFPYKVITIASGVTHLDFLTFNIASVIGRGAPLRSRRRTAVAVRPADPKLHREEPRAADGGLLRPPVSAASSPPATCSRLGGRALAFPPRARPALRAHHRRPHRQRQVGAGARPRRRARRHRHQRRQHAGLSRRADADGAAVAGGRSARSASPVRRSRRRRPVLGRPLAGLGQAEMRRRRTRRPHRHRRRRDGALSRGPAEGPGAGAAGPAGRAPRGGAAVREPGRRALPRPAHRARSARGRAGAGRPPAPAPRLGGVRATGRPLAAMAKAQSADPPPRPAFFIVLSARRARSSTRSSTPGSSACWPPAGSTRPGRCTGATSIRICRC